MRRIRTLRSAVTIIEVAMAIVILSIALPPLVMGFSDAASQSIDPIRMTTAAFLATERMEEIVARRYRGTAGYGDVIAANFPDETPASGFGAFNRTVTISFVNSSMAGVGSDQGYKKVRVTVSWSGGTQQVIVEHVFADF